MSRRFFSLRPGSASTSLPPSKPSDLSIRFLVDDISGAGLVGSRLNNVLSMIADKRPIHPLHKKFLRDRGAHALADLIDGAISDTAYAACARADRDKRVEAARLRAIEVAEIERREAALAAERLALLRAEAEKTQARLRAEAEERLAARIRYENSPEFIARQARLRAEAEERSAARIRYENSPEFIAKQKAKEKSKVLLHNYDVHEYVEPAHFKRLLAILYALDSGARLGKEDVVWLKAHAHHYDFAGVLSAHHRREADMCIAEFRRGGDPWQAVNASGHLRKCSASKEAVDLLTEIPAQRLKHNKLKSAMLTTRGGALRDLKYFPTAQEAGEAAHALLPRDYRPCTLLGAVHIQQGNYELGHDWYRKAEERGAPAAGNDQEIRSLLRAMSEEKRQTAVAELIRIDPDRYKSLNDWLRKQRRSSRP